MTDVVVVGAGISGLVAAWRLEQAGYGVRLLEASERIGGNVGTINESGYVMELGPYSFPASADAIWCLVEDLNFEEMLLPAQSAADKRYIYRDGRLHALPMSLRDFLGTRLLSLRAKLRLMLEPFIPGGAKENDTAWEYFCRRFGVEAATYIMGPFVSGIYAGDVKRLGARAAFPKFWGFERDSGSMILGAIGYMRAKKKRLAAEGRKMHKGLYGFEGGMGSLTNTLVSRLKSQVSLNSRVVSVNRNSGVYNVETERERIAAPALLLAIQPQDAATLLDNVLPNAKTLLRNIPMAPVTLVHWSPSEADADMLPPGFGFLVPRLYDLRVLGTVMASEVFAGRAPEGQQLYTSYYGGVLDPEFMQLSDDEVLERLIRDHTTISGRAMKEPRFMKIMRYKNAIPQLVPTHPELVADIQKLVADMPGLSLAGNYLSGVAMNAAVDSGYAAASSLGEYLTGVSSAPLKAAS